MPEDPDVRPGDLVGRAGAEKQFDSALRGVPGIVNTEVDKKTGRLTRNVLFPAQAGSNLYLALSGPAQRVAEQKLAGLVGAAVVMDLRTGELAVLASSPSFDPAIRPITNDLSRATQDSVAPGSVFKPVVALAASAGGFGSERTFTCDGVLRYGGVTFHCEGRHGVVNMEQAIAVSCNIYFFQAARQAGAPAILSWASALNLGRRTGVDLPDEKAGRLPQLYPGWPAGQTMNLGIGQGDLSVTPLQIAVMYAAIANGGKSPRPTIRHRIEPPPEEDMPGAADVPPPCEVSLPADGLRAVRDGMRQCTIGGTASGVPGLRELRAAVKTGTAETRDRAINQAWIAGYLPWDSPRWAFAVVVHNVPGYGAQIAGPIAAATLQALSAKPE
jgi:penicillin-binding protein 2